MAAPVTVVCMKWGSLYGPDYVNVLRRAVAANLAKEHQFVCLTDDAEGLDPETKVYPLPDFKFGPGEFAFGGWPKLSVFSQDLYGLKGRALFIDLDTVILGPLDDLFEIPGGVVLIREWPRLGDYLKVRREIRGMSSIFAFTLGSETHLLTDYLADPTSARASVRHEQAWITAHAKDLRFWPDGLIVSFKKTLMAPPILNRFRPPDPPPADARVLVFHGVPRPIDVVPDKNQVWGSFWRYGRGAVPFVRNYWLKYGGKDPG